MVEVVIVLAISALVIVTTTIPYQKRNAELSEEQFWRDVKQRWQEAQTRARVEGKADRSEKLDLSITLIVGRR